MVTLYPNPGGHSSGALTLSPNKTDAIEIISDDYRISAAELAMSAESEHRLIYTTPVLKKDIHLSGTPKVHLNVAASKKAVNLSVYLVALPWVEQKGRPITDNLITRGWADPQNISLRKSHPLIPGEFVAVSFDLMPDDQIIPQGTKIGLMIFSSDSDFTLRPQPGTRLSVDLDGSYISLPVVGGQAAYDSAIE